MNFVSDVKKFLYMTLLHNFAKSHKLKYFNTDNLFKRSMQQISLSKSCNIILQIADTFQTLKIT